MFDLVFSSDTAVDTTKRDQVIPILLNMLILTRSVLNVILGELPQLLTDFDSVIKYSTNKQTRSSQIPLLAMAHLYAALRVATLSVFFTIDL